MAQQMNTILLLLIFTGLVGMLLVIFFMLDRVNELHKHADLQKIEIKPDESFGGLSGKNLWDAMIGIPMRGLDQKKLVPLKQRYELVLQKHLELLFEDGKLDAREGFSMPVKCDRLVPTLRGEIESWIPHEFASGIYRAGHAMVSTPDVEHDMIRHQVDMIGDAIFSATGVPQHPLSKILIPLAIIREDKETESEDDNESLTDADGNPMAGADGLPALPPPDEPNTLPVFDFQTDNPMMADAGTTISEAAELQPLAASANPANNTGQPEPEAAIHQPETPAEAAPAEAAPAAAAPAAAAPAPASPVPAA